MHKSAFSLVLLVLFAIPAADAVGQQAPRALTLDQAKRIAWTSNPGVRRATTDLTLAELRQRQARNNVFIPQFGSGLSFSIGRFRRYTAEDFAGEPLPNPYYAEAVSSSTSQSVRLSMQLFSFGSWLNLRSAQTSVRQSEQGMSVEMHRAGAEVERRFYQVLLADDAVLLEERLMNTARERLAAEKGKLAAGVSLPADMLGAEIEVLDQEMRLEQSRGEALKARLLLLDALGMTEDVELQPVGAVPEAFDPAILSDDAIVERALSSSPRIRQADVALENSRLQQRNARAFRWPTVSGFASYSRNRSTSGSEAFWELNPQNRGYDLGLQVSVPVPVLRFNENLSIRAADVSHAQLVEEDATSRATLERQVRAALIDLDNAWRGMESAQRRAALSTERARLAGEQHRYGTITFIEFQQINDAEAQSQRALLNARVGFTNARIALEELLGGPVRE
ncbi:MAG TPA: TolC family protein [Longimicrobiales bacterium]|nr:TolC family protein [Longimicrobiales bacterium]